MLDRLLVGGNSFLCQLLLQITTFILAYNSHSRNDVDDRIYELHLTYTVALVTIHVVKQLTDVLNCEIQPHSLKALDELILSHTVLRNCFYPHFRLDYGFLVRVRLVLNKVEELLVI